MAELQQCQFNKNDDLPKGLMRKIIREDLGINIEEFEESIRKYK
jgi:hypothetical protein